PRPPATPPPFPYTTLFRSPDYSPEDLLRIATLMLAQREYRLTDPARRTLAAVLRRQCAVDDPNFGNARYVRNLIERAIRRQAVRDRKSTRLNSSHVKISYA